ncbi:MAG: hypothetical protein HY900_25040 [Deltaproteobacteria bacterium]|nr:hypothetical protein [Deltaproteobacteria bacterium]
MKRRPFRTATVLLLVLGTTLVAGCKLPQKMAGFLRARYGPTPAPTPVPTPALAPGPEIKVDFFQLFDARVRGDSEVSDTQVDLEIPGTKRGEVAAARVVVRKAVDDLGTNLVRDDAAEAGLEPTVGGEAEAPVFLSLHLKNAPRKAKSIAEVSGDLELYSPLADPDALVTFRKFLGELGKPLESVVLRASEVEIAMVSPADLEAAKKAAGDKAAAEAQKTGLGEEMVKQSVEFALDSFFAPSPGDVVLKVKDPKKRIQSFAFVDPAGAINDTNRAEQAGFVVVSAQGEAPGPDWGLQVRLQTPKTLKRYSFTLKDIILP